MDNSFRFKQFSLHNEASAFKVGTDAVLLGACMTLDAKDRHLLDIGTGTGVIALLCAQRLSEKLGKKSGSEAGDSLNENSESRKKDEDTASNGGSDFLIEAVEIDEASAKEAELNFRESPWSGKLQVIHSPFQDFAYKNKVTAPSVGDDGLADGKKYDCIFSNPPYFDESLRNPDERESAARHTETLSYREICAFASKALKPAGRLSLVLPADSEKALVRCAASYSLQLFRLVRIRTSQRKPVKRIIAEFVLRAPLSESPIRPAPCLPAEEEINLQKPNPTDKFYLK